MSGSQGITYRPAAPDNAAVRLYLALGFERVGGSGGSITLMRTLEPAGNRDA